MLNHPQGFWFKFLQLGILCQPLWVLAGDGVAENPGTKPAVKAPSPMEQAVKAENAGKPGAAAADGKDKPVKEYKPRRWSLTAGGSQRKDWFTGKERFDWPAFNAKTVLGLPEWLNASLEYRIRYETFDNPWAKGQTGSQWQAPMQTVLFMEAHHKGFRVGMEFWDARQVGAHANYTLNNTMVDTAAFPQMYAAWSGRNIFNSGLAFEAKGGMQTIEFGSRRLVARNAFRNTTNSFTGLLLKLGDDEGAWQVQAFGTQPVLRLPDQKAELLNNDYAWDPTSTEAVFTGLFGSARLPFYDINSELYLYYLGEDSTTTSYRRLFTPGFRIFRNVKKGEPDFEVESIAQTGERFDAFYSSSGNSTKLNAPVEAFFEHVQAGYTFDLPWDPRIMLQYDYATGGTSGGTSHSFDTLFGARRWEYGPTGIFGPFARNNINSPGTRLFLVPHRDVSTFLAYRAWWLADSKAAWQPAGLIDPEGQSGNFMGQTVELSARWDAHENIAFEGGWTCLIKGDFARNAPGAPSNHDSVNYFYVQTQMRF